ncbi:uncharacterized protein LOC122056177 isoform X2 [Zingiber officinale]|uniref:uncharacterized protein LOC122056177 isoform X2 n=1 Tax=Zingiber officinale TaxID=94328 RepID=UPI001C4ABC66|nr:uncharacterized protein LOC122056177 isoform X2 [Zingiber officinale]
MSTITKVLLTNVGDPCPNDLVSHRRTSARRRSNHRIVLLQAICALASIPRPSPLHHASATRSPLSRSRAPKSFTLLCPGSGCCSHQQPLSILVAVGRRQSQVSGNNLLQQAIFGSCSSWPWVIRDDFGIEIKTRNKLRKRSKRCFGASNQAVSK